MSAVESYDGLCGIIHLYASSEKQVRCKYEFGHHGPHSWVKEKVSYNICGGITRQEVEERAAKGSPAAQAILAVMLESDKK
jgi:hypothetical protein